ncbi:hypothetical protein RI129_011129 [Pyrocoelia pectoralis]|uniref:UDP-glucuronosyltransferase n=1 Tax=Pyrocoelia pectoralis TaxID=417401 RepID=A0AAN7V4V4_9COLE
MILFVLSLFVLQCHGARILAIIPTPSYSHNIVVQPLWKELSLRGHHVTTLTTEPIRDPRLINLTEIDLGFSYKTMLKNLQKKIYSDHLELYKFGYLRHAEVCDEQLGHPLLQAIIKNQSESFDLVIAESSRLPILAFAHRFRCPSIGITTLDATPTMYSLLGNPTHPLLYPDTWLDLEKSLTIVERVKRVLLDTQIAFFQTRTLFPLYDEMIQKHFGEGYPPAAELMKSVSVQFVNTDPIFHAVRPLTPTIIQIGGGLHRLTQKSLPHDLRTVLDNAKEGFIYFSLGSYAKSNSMSPNLLNIILETFAELPYLVLWKYESKHLPNKSDNVVIYDWVPQMGVLNHANIKLFITHGGLQSLNEAIDAGVPIVGLPLFADQPHNVQRMVSKGCGLLQRHNTLDKNGFKSTITEVIKNPRYRHKIKELGELANDQPMTGLERAVWWTEYVLRHKGAQHLKSTVADIPFYQYYLLDVASVLFSVITLMTLSLYFILKFIFRFLQAKVKKD